MNYIRGAVNAISAPYLYYKDLPPINPSTLTGAIDVIVVQRPTPDGGSELACSPFHVRFGKWQVLRPAEKKVNVSVNGNPIPYNMKVGEAGEAFFVFETQEDVPDDLITSPLLQPTRPDEVMEATSLPTGDAHPPLDPTGVTASDEIPEPEFLDLNAMPYVGGSLNPSLSNESDIHRLSPSPSLSTPPTPETPATSPPSFPSSESVIDIRDDGHLAPNIRANSEPPLDLNDGHPDHLSIPSSISLPVQEYSWDWGAFPQPSPITASLTKNRRLEGNSIDGNDAHTRWSGSSDQDKQSSDNGFDPKTVRSQSVPPDLEGSPTANRHELPKAGIYRYGNGGHFMTHGEIQDQFGAGGKLSARKGEPTLFVVTIEDQKVSFELSLIEDDDGSPASQETELGRPPIQQDEKRRMVKRSEVETAQLFERGRVTYTRFIEDENILKDEQLVIRWAHDQYITRNDGSPLMDALALWRNSAIKREVIEIPSRPVSPSPSENLSVNGRDVTDDTPSVDERDQGRFKLDQPEQLNLSRKPTSSSWVRWWRRGQAKEVDTAAAPPAVTSRPSSSPTKSQFTQPQVSDPIPFPTSVPNHPPAPASKSTHSPKKTNFIKSLRLSSDQLRSLNLKPGANTITFSLSTTGVIACTARIFVWDSTDVIVISDIDGTITKSDGLGHVFAMIGRDWTQIGVAKLYTDIARNGYKLLYLTSRAIGQADATRGYLRGIRQNNYQLPEGPVIMSPDRLIASLHREVIMRKPELFKMACLRDIQKLFGEASRNPFYAGFGNRITDALSYRSVDVPSRRIFTIDSSGEVKMELLELAGYKSSYIHMTDLVDQMFPPIHRKWADDFTDFNYWKPPMQDFPLPDLSPPSPALSARSDASNQSTFSRLRNFSLVPNRYTSSRSQVDVSHVTPETRGDSLDSGQRTPQLQQMSSFERLGATIAGFARSSSASPSGSRRSMSRESRASSLTYADTAGSDDEHANEWDEIAKRRRRARATSVTSMPGSLDDIHFAIDSGDESGYSDHGTGEEEYEGEMEVEEVNEEVLDEDFLATTQMKNVPFI